MITQRNWYVMDLKLHFVKLNLRALHRNGKNAHSVLFDSCATFKVWKSCDLKYEKGAFFGYSTNQEQGTVDETRIEPFRSRNQCPSSFQLYQKVHTFVSAICSHYMCKLHNIACYVVCGHVKYIVWRFDCGLIFAHHRSSSAIRAD